MKDFFYALYMLTTRIILWLPIQSIRKAYLKIVLGSLGKETFIARNVDIRRPRNIYIGNNVVINKRAILDGRGGKLVIGNNVDIAQEVNIWTLQHDYNDDFHKTKGGDVTIKDYVWIAARATILPGITIGRGAVIATMSVVTKDIPEMMVVGGIPAKPISARHSKLKYKLKYKPLFQ